MINGLSPSSVKRAIYVPSSFHDSASRIVRKVRRPGALRRRSSYRVRLRSDNRDILLSLVLLYFDLDGAFPFLLRVPKPLMESGIVPA